MLSALPPQLHVFVRDWLSANNVLLKSRDGHVLVDTGYLFPETYRFVDELTLRLRLNLHVAHPAVSAAAS